MKGIAPFVIGLCVAIALIIGEAVFLNTFIEERIAKESIAKEVDYLNAVDRVGMINRGLPFALYYSFKEALREGGYESFLDVRSNEEFSKNILLIFDDYVSEIERKTGVIIPKGTVKLSFYENQILMSFESPSFMEYKHESKDLKFKIFENVNTTIWVCTEYILSNYECYYNPCKDFYYDLSNCDSCAYYFYRDRKYCCGYLNVCSTEVCGPAEIIHYSCYSSGCADGVSYICDSEYACESVGCQGNIYHCTYDGSTWQWRKSKPTEICDDNIDNNCDGYIDCNDRMCFNNTICLKES